MKKIICFVLCLLIFAGCSAIETKDPLNNEISEEIIPTVEVTKEETKEETKEPEEFKIKLSFVGDCMLACLKDNTTGGSFNEYAKNNPPEYFLSKVKHIFENDDFTTVNLENVLTDQNLSEIEKDITPSFWFKSNPENIKILTSSSVEGVSLANNHTKDYGEEGYKDTIKTVENAKLSYGTTNDKILYYEKEGFKIGVICTTLWSERGTAKIIRKIKEAEENSDYQIVFYHGGTENLHSPEVWKQNESRKLIDNGADLVIGNHPHVLQPREIYKGKEIIYSLGNFCYGGHRSPKNRTIIYQIELKVENMTVKEEKSDMIPCYVYTGKVNNYQPAPIEDDEEIKNVLDFMNGKRELPY